MRESRRPVGTRAERRREDSRPEAAASGSLSKRMPPRPGEDVVDEEIDDADEPPIEPVASVTTQRNPTREADLHVAVHVDDAGCHADDVAPDLFPMDTVLEIELRDGDQVVERPTNAEIPDHRLEVRDAVFEADIVSEGGRGSRPSQHVGPEVALHGERPQIPEGIG